MHALHLSANCSPIFTGRDVKYDEIEPKSKREPSEDLASYDSRWIVGAILATALHNDDRLFAEALIVESKHSDSWVRGCLWNRLRPSRTDPPDGDSGEAHARLGEVARRRERAGEGHGTRCHRRHHEVCGR
jgi:hypothetical protein